MQEHQQTRGDYLVGTGFNPSQDNRVATIKGLAAELIDEIDLIEPPVGASDERAHQIARCKAAAITSIEQGAMWAVKAATKPERA